MGARYHRGPFAAAFDVTYVPTPVPKQTGRTNYVDNDRIGTSLGAEYGFHVMHTTLALGAQVQVNRLVPREQIKLPTPTQPNGAVIAPERVKDELPDDAQLGGDPLPSAAGLQTNNPGWPGFASGGWIVGASLYLSLAI